MYKSTILILGGGVGGIVTANNLRKKLSKDYKIILIAKKQRTFFSSVVSLVNG